MNASLFVNDFVTYCIRVADGCLLPRSSIWTCPLLSFSFSACFSAANRSWWSRTCSGVAGQKSSSSENKIWNNVILELQNINDYKSGLFFQHFSLNSRRNKLKDLAKLKDFMLNSSIFLPKLKFLLILRSIGIFSQFFKHKKVGSFRYLLVKYVHCTMHGNFY